MNKIIGYALGLVLVVFVFACGNEEDNLTVTTDFNKSTIEGTTYSLGDTVKADISLKFKKPMDKIITMYSIGTTGKPFETVQIGALVNDYIYKFRFPLDPKIFKSGDLVSVFINAQGVDKNVAPFATKFTIKIK
jgi:hypothetical protein